MIAIYFPVECLIPRALHALRVPLSLTNAQVKNYHFSIPKKTTYCLFIEQDRVFPLQANECTQKPFYTLEQIEMSWQIEHNQQMFQKG
jgi:hypothetical protein